MTKHSDSKKILSELHARASAIGAEIFPVSIGKGMPVSRPPQAFVSHSRLDKGKPLFQSLIQDLRSLFGIDLWLDGGEISVGDSVLQKISEGISNADFILHIISEKSSIAHWPKQEFELAYASQLNQKKAKILPIKIDGSPIPTYLRSLRVFDLAADYSGALRDLGIILTTDRHNSIASFGIDSSYYKKTIIDVSDQVGRKLIEYFAKNPAEMRKMDRRKFEEMVAELFSGFGYSVELTAKTRDGGRDVVAIKQSEVHVKYLIECKRPDPGGYVGIRPVRELYGVKVHEGASKAILATTAYFSKDALLFFEDHKWELEPREYNGILEWINDYLKK